MSPHFMRHLLFVAVLLTSAIYFVWMQRKYAVTNKALPKVSTTYLVDINHATAQELSVLPAVGEKTAQTIVGERDTNGFFKSAEDLARVKGLGERKLKKIMPFIKTKE